MDNINLEKESQGFEIIANKAMKEYVRSNENKPSVEGFIRFVDIHLSEILSDFDIDDKQSKRDFFRYIKSSHIYLAALLFSAIKTRHLKEEIKIRAFEYRSKKNVWVIDTRGIILSPYGCPFHTKGDDFLSCTSWTITPELSRQLRENLSFNKEGSGGNAYWWYETETAKFLNDLKRIANINI